MNVYCLLYKCLMFLKHQKPSTTFLILILTSFIYLQEHFTWEERRKAKSQIPDSRVVQLVIDSFKSYNEIALSE